MVDIMWILMIVLPLLVLWVAYGRRKPGPPGPPGPQGPVGFLDELKQDNDVEEDPEFVHLLVPARDVPDGDVVLKKGGSFEYRLWRKLKVFDAPGKELTGDDCVFLVSGKGVVAALQLHKMVLWKVTPEQAIQYLEDRGRDV